MQYKNKYFTKLNTQVGNNRVMKTRYLPFLFENYDLVKIFVGSRLFFQLITEHIVLGWSAGSSAHDWNQYKFKVEETNQLITKIYRVGQTFFSKERNILAFFYILYKRTLCSLHSFTFFIKVRGILCVLLRSI